VVSRGLLPPAGVRGGLQHDRRPLPAHQHRQDHRPGGPGEDEPPAHDAAVVLRAVVPHARRVRRQVRERETRLYLYEL